MIKGETAPRRSPRELERISNSNNPSWARGGPRDPQIDGKRNGRASIDAFVF